MLLQLSSKTELWNWIAEHISTNKATLHLAVCKRKDQSHGSNNTPTLQPDQLSYCDKQSKSESLNHKCSRVTEQTNEVGCSGALNDLLWACAWRRFPKSGPPSGACGKMWICLLGVNEKTNGLNKNFISVRADPNTSKRRSFNRCLGNPRLNENSAKCFFTS